MEQHGSETQATIEALTELLKSSRSATELHRASEARFQDMQQVLQTIEHASAYPALGIAWGVGDLWSRGFFRASFTSELPLDVCMACWRPSPPSVNFSRLPPKPFQPTRTSAIDASATGASGYRARTRPGAEVWGSVSVLAACRA